MKEKFYKYAELLLKRGLYLNSNQPLVISAPIESVDFVRVLTDVACSLGVRDIYYDWSDEELKHIQLAYFEEDDIKASSFWNKAIHDEYAKKNAAFLFLASSSNMMQDIDSNKLKVALSNSLNTRKIYRDMQMNNEVAWCIASVATEEWSKIVFPDVENSYDLLWNKIFDICLINSDNPLSEWDEKLLKNHQICQKLNELNIKELHYKSSNGTDLVVGLPENCIWAGGSSVIKGRELIVNLPTEEVFTTPNKFLTNGVIYSSLPLVHAGTVINDICLKFENGKVVSFDASSGLNELKNIIEFDLESSMLGEVALVDVNSKIAQSNILFYETLYDENASCHIALGSGFKECISGGIDMDENSLEKVGYNKSRNHVDMMIGTNDLNITAITYDGSELLIFRNGSFNI